MGLQSIPFIPFSFSPLFNSFRDRHLIPMRKPLIALILAIIPFFVFFGSESVVEVNGVVTSHSRFNILGIVLGAFAIGMALSVLRQRDASGGVKALGGVAALVAVAQLAVASGMLRGNPLDWINPDRNLPALQYVGGQNLDGKVPVGNDSLGEIKFQTQARVVDLIRLSRLHVAYADKCHGGRYRMDTQAALVIPDIFTDKEKADIVATTDRYKLPPPVACTQPETDKVMGRLVDQMNQDMDAVAAYVRLYRKTEAKG